MSAEQRPQSQNTQARNENEEIRSNESQARTLVRLGQEAKFFTDESGEVYAAVMADGRPKLLKVKSRQFKAWLTGRYFEETDDPAGTDAMRKPWGFWKCWQKPKERK
ncbi:MAG: hypothetical protein RO469_15920 [Thermincola sp.]|nr:hypothetical protein [Thermincola sp.]MDT3704518.1 hypothetical protein [Thermincola sp.]